MLTASQIPTLAQLGIHPMALYGRDESHLVSCQDVMLETRTASAFLAMAEAAKQAGFALTLCSGHRSFDKQQAIWNAKANGKRAVLDAQSQAVDTTLLTDHALILLILCWSALPGASRHHWGTDLDVFDANHIDRDRLALVESEYTDTGPCAPLAKWLQQHAHQFGFYFPYQKGLSGVSPEPWHLSFFPVSNTLLKHFSANALANVLAQSNVMLKSCILEHLDGLVAEYVLRVAPVMHHLDAQ